MELVPIKPAIGALVEELRTRAVDGKLMPPGDGWPHPQDLVVQQQRLSFFSSPTPTANSISSIVLFTSQEKVGRGPSSSARISTATIATRTGMTVTQHRP